MKILINCTNAFIGDILFASSLARKFKEESPDNHITYFIPLMQPYELLLENPYIDKIITRAINLEYYDRVFMLPEVDQNYPATYYFQSCAGIKKPSVEYEVFVPEYYDRYGFDWVDSARRIDDQPVVAWQLNWEWKAYQTTEELLKARQGGPHRNITKIIADLSPYMTLIAMGFDRSVSSRDAIAQDQYSYARTAGVIKHCDWMLGSEGGLTNLAAGVGTKCIITTDFIYQNYGPMGFVKQCQNPMMGPQVYFPDAGHVHLHPYMTDAEITETIFKIVTGK